MTTQPEAAPTADKDTIRRSNRRRYLFALAGLTVLLFNYPFVLIAERILPEMALPLVLFAAWALIIAILFAIVRNRKSASR